MFINDVAKRFSYLVANVYNVQINGKTIGVYQLMVINKTDLELLHSTIQRLKLSSPQAFISISIVYNIATDMVIAYLIAQNFQYVGSYQQDFGFGGKLNTYWKYTNIFPPCT